MAEPEFNPKRSGPECSNFTASHTKVNPVREISFIHHKFITVGYNKDTQRGFPPGGSSIACPSPSHLINPLREGKYYSEL